MVCFPPIDVDCIFSKIVNVDNIESVANCFLDTPLKNKKISSLQADDESAYFVCRIVYIFLIINQQQILKSILKTEVFENSNNKPSWQAHTCSTALP